MKKNIVIIGAESGIGLATVRSFQKQGHAVWATAEDLNGIEILRKEIPKERVLELDLMNVSAISPFVDELSNVPQIDVLICNAGVGIGGPATHMDIVDLRESFQINVFGHLEIIQRVLPILEKSDDSRIIWTGSAAGYFVRPLFGGYAATKFAVSALCDALRVELMGRVQVSMIAPGRIKTPIWEKGESLAEKVKEKPGVEIYATAIQKLIDEAKANQTESPSVDIVVESMHHAAFSSRPKAIYRIGPDAKVAFWLKWLLPIKWVDWLLRKLCW